MPIYEWKCKGCGHQFEAITSMSEDGSAVQCPKCRETGAEKQMSACAPCGPKSGGSGGGCGHSHSGGFS